MFPKWAGRRRQALSGPSQTAASLPVCHPGCPFLRPPAGTPAHGWRPAAPSAALGVLHPQSVTPCIILNSHLGGRNECTVGCFRKIFHHLKSNIPRTMVPCYCIKEALYIITSLLIKELRQPRDIRYIKYLWLNANWVVWLVWERRGSTECCGLQNLCSI